MSTLVFSLPTAPAATSATSNAGAATAAARGRDSQERADADGFGAALARSRDARTRSAEDKADSASSSEPASRRRGSASDAEKEKSPAELLAMALLTPAFAAQAAQQRQAAAQGDASSARGLADATAHDPLASAAASMAQPDAAPASDADMPVDAAAAAHADAKDDKAAKADAKPRIEATDDKTRTASPTPAVPAAPVAALPAATQGASAARNAGAADAKSSVAATQAATAKAAPEVQAAASAHAEEASLGDSQDSQPDTPANLTGALGFKAALADATGPSSTTQAQNLPRFAVHTPVGSEGWGADIGTQMIRMGADGHHVAELSLNPAGLGPLKVTLTLGDNQAQAMFVSAHESVRRAVEAALPQLRDTLAGQGIQLGQASVDAGTQQQQAFGQERGFESPARPSSGQREPQRQAASADAAPVRSAPGTRAGSAIDTFA